MKQKGITIWEQHLERIVLGVAALFFLAFGGLQLISKPNAVDRQPQGTINPGEVDGLLESTAQNLQQRLAPEAPAAFEVPDHRPVLDLFTASLGAPISPATAMQPSHRRVVVAEEIDDGGGDVPYNEPVIGAPQAVAARQFFDAVAEEEVLNVPELAELPAFEEVPYDVTWVTAAAVFPVSDVLAEFQRTGPDGANPIPVNWYFNTVNVLDVVVEREEYVDGTWTNLTTLDPLPGRYSLREQLAGKLDRSGRDAMLDELRDDAMRRAVMQPAFFATLNDNFTPPDPRVSEEVAEEASEEEQAMRILVNKIRRESAARDRMMEELKEAGGTMDPPEPPDRKPPPERPGAKPPGGAGGGAGGGDRGGRPGGKPPPKAPPGARPPGAGGMPGFGAGGSESPGADKKKNERLIRNLKKKIRASIKRIDRFSRQLAELVGPDQAAAMIAGVAAEGAGSGITDLDGDRLVVWAHDMAVEPDRTYRYRFTVKLYNPFFGHKLELIDSQHELAESIALASQASAWSEPLEAIPPRKVWIVKAGAPPKMAGRLGLGEATAEVYQFSHGRWWRESFRVQPGDRVGGKEMMELGGSEVEVDFGTDWFVLDIVPNIDARTAQRDRGLGATVVLQRLGGDTDQYHDPGRDRDDEARQRLFDEVEEAESEGLASAAP
jgi:hypothetical protein